MFHHRVKDCDKNDAGPHCLQGRRNRGANSITLECNKGNGGLREKHARTGHGIGLGLLNDMSYLLPLSFFL